MYRKGNLIGLLEAAQPVEVLQIIGGPAENTLYKAYDQEGRVYVHTLIGGRMTLRVSDLRRTPEQAFVIAGEVLTTERSGRRYLATYDVQAGCGELKMFPAAEGVDNTETV